MKYNGVDPTTLHAGISIAKEIPPGAPTSQLETLSGSAGEIVAGRTLKQAEYIVRINVAGKTRAEAWAIRALIAKWACATESVPHELEPSHWPGIAYDAVLKEISPPEFAFGFGVIEVVFAIPRPISHGTSERSASGSTSVTINVQGSSYIRPKITVTTRAASRAEIAVDGKVYAAVDYSFSAGNSLVLETDPPKVRIVSGGSSVEADKYVDYTVTDFDAMCKALTTGTHRLNCNQASAITARWKEEYL